MNPLEPFTHSIQLTKPMLLSDTCKILMVYSLEKVKWHSLDLRTLEIMDIVLKSSILSSCVVTKG